MHLGAPIDRRVRTDHSLYGADVDDRPAPLLGHRVPERPGDGEQPGGVDLHTEREIGQIVVDAPAHRPEDRIVHQHVDAPGAPGDLVSQRKDGGWCWTRANSDSDWVVTAMSFWALCKAREQGIAFHPDALKKAQTFLKNMFTRVGANDNDAKATILHAPVVVRSTIHRYMDDLPAFRFKCEWVAEAAAA